jgi:flagellar biosynthesis chaperone FliJ
MVNHFDIVLARYQQNLTEYKATANSALKPAVDEDKKWLDAYIASLEQTSRNQQSFIQKFVKDYQNTNPELVEMQTKIKEIREKGPVLQDAYETEQQGRKEEEIPEDYTSYYVKAGLIVGVATAVWLVSALRPAYMR